MALKVVDRVKETTTTTGTGTVNLAGAASGFRTFVAGVGDGNTTYYAITDANGTAWEVGLGTVTDASPDTLARTTLLASSTGSKISLSSGTHTVFATYPGSKAVFTDADGHIVPLSDDAVDLGTSSVEFRNAYFDGTVTSDAFAGPLTGAVTGNADTATTSTNITASANNSTDETVYPAFVDGATGTQGIETDTGLTYNPSTGTFTSTVFVGALTGNASGSSGSCTGNAATVTNGVYTTSKISVLAATSSSELAGVISDETGSGSLVFSNSPTLVTPALGTPSQLVGTNISGTASSLTAGTATVATTVTITDNENTNEDNAIIFTAGGDVDGGNLGLESDGDLIYNPSTGTVTATIFKGNIDAVDGDFDGTLEADAYTVDGVALNEYIADTVGAMVGSNTETNITVTYEDGDNTLDFVIGTLNQDTTGTADNITVSANNSTDETVYPVFVDGATGSQGAETDTGFTYNPSTGTVTSTVFVGALTGNASGTAATVTAGTQAAITTLANVTTVGTIGTGVWQGTAIASSYIAADAIDGSKLADNAVNSEHYTDGSIDHVHLAADCVDGDNIQDDVINSEHIAADSIDAEHYAAGSVDATAIGNDVVNSQHYAAASIDNEHLADDAVGTAEIADDAITSALIADDAIVSAAIADDAVLTAHIADDQITAALMADNSINSDMYVDGSIDTAHIADNQVTLAKIATITDERILGRIDDSTATVAELTKAQVLTMLNVADGATASAGTVTSVTAGAGMTQSGTASVNPTLDGVGGDGITANTNDVAITAAQTTITSVYNAALVIGRDSHTDIDFATDNNIIFRAGDEDQLTLVDGALTPSSNAIVDLGTDALEFKDGYFDGTLEADAITVDGVALATYIRDTVGTNMLSSNTESGITVTYDTSNDNIDFAIDAAQTGITSLLAADIKIGEDDQTKIDFETADEIHFYAANVEQVYLADNIFGPQSDSDVDLGATGVRWKDAFVDSITVTGEIDGDSLDIEGDADINGTLEADAITVGGTNVVTGSLITTLGTISAGVWEGTDVAVAHGGTGASSLTDGGILLGNGTGAIVAMSVLGNGGIVGGDGDADPTTITAFTASDGVLKHEVGGLELDISGIAKGDVIAGTGTGSVGIVTSTGHSDGDVLTLQADGTADWEAVSGGGSGDITGVTLAGDSGSAADTSGNADLTVAGGNGITTSGSSTTLTVALDAALTTVTSLLATDIKIGEDDQTKIDFETADEIHFYAANVEQVYLADNIFGPQSDSDVDLGTTGVRWKDAYIDTITTTGDVDVLGNIELGHASDTTIARASSGQITVEGTAVILAGAVTGITSLLATDIKIGEDDQTKIDFETADEIHFYAANVEQVYLADNIFGPQSDSDVDLGTTGVRWKDAFIDTITTTGDVDVLGNIELGHASDTTIARASSGQITVEGTAVILAGAVTGITSLLATDIKIGEDAQTAIDFETANEIHFDADNAERVKITSDGLYVDKIRRHSDSSTTTKILLNDEALKLYAGHSSNQICTIDSTGLTIDSGSLETATIDYTDGDNAMTIADGGKVTFAAGFAVGSDQAGDVLYHNGTSYVRLAIGSDGQVLTVNDAENAPGWENAGGGSARSVAGDTDNGIVTWVTGDDTFAVESNLSYTGGDLLVGGSTPSVTIGDAGTEDTKLVFDGNAQDFYIGLDDTDDDLKIGLGSAVGTTPVISMTGAGALSVGVADTGYDLKLFGATSGKYWMWDESADGVRLRGNFVQEAVPVANSGTTIGSGVSVIDIDWAAGNYHWVKLNDTAIDKIVFRNMKRGGRYILRIEQAGSAQTVAWGTVVCDDSDTAFTELRWVAQTAPTMSTGTTATDVYGVLCTRSNGRGADGFVIAQNLVDAITQDKED